MKIEVFTRKGCPLSRYLKARLEKAGIEFRERRLDDEAKDIDAMADAAMLNIPAVPTLVIDRNVISFQAVADVLEILEKIRPEGKKLE